MNQLAPLFDRDQYDRLRLRCLLFLLLKHRHHIGDRPHAIGQTGSHGGSDAQRLVNAAEVVEEIVKVNRRDVVCQLLAESIREALKATIGHADREVHALAVAGVDVGCVRVSRDGVLDGSAALRRAVALLTLDNCGVLLHKLRVIHIGTENILDGINVNLEPVGAELDALRQTLCQVGDERLRTLRVTQTDEIRHD